MLTVSQNKFRSLWFFNFFLTSIIKTKYRYHFFFDEIEKIKRNNVNKKVCVTVAFYFERL